MVLETSVVTLADLQEYNFVGKILLFLPMAIFIAAMLWVFKRQIFGAGPCESCGGRMGAAACSVVLGGKKHRVCKSCWNKVQRDASRRGIDRLRSEA